MLTEDMSTNAWKYCYYRAICSKIQSNTDTTKAEVALVVIGFSCNNASVYTRPSEAV